MVTVLAGATTVTVLEPPDSMMAVVLLPKVEVPPPAATRVTLSFNVRLPEKRDAPAAAPPMSLVPVLLACTVTLRPTVKAPPTSKAAYWEPEVLPTNTSDVALPRAPAKPLGAAAPTINVPPWTNVGEV